MILYHYTDQNGFMSIIRDTEITATSIQYLEDTRDYYLTLDIVRDVLSEMLIREENSDVQFRIQRFRANINNIKRINTCICSLSEEGDHLSQWQSYSPPQGGYSIGFDRNILEELLNLQGYVLKACLYDFDEQRALITKAITDALIAFHNYNEPEKGWFEYQSESSAYFVNNLSRIIPLIKHSPFAEEKEWRIISEEDVSIERLSFKEGPFMLIPFHRIMLRKDFWKLIRKVVIGNTPQPELAFMAAQKFIHRQEIEASRIMVVKNDDKNISVVKSFLKF